MKQQFTGPISLDVAARTVTLHGIALPAERVLLAVNSTVGFIYHIHEHEPANISTVADATGGILSAVGYDAIGSFNGNLNIYQGGIDKGGIVHISGGVITVVNKGSGYTAGFANTVGGTRLVIAIDPSFSTVIHFAAYKDCDTHQNTDAVSVFYEDGVDLGKLIKDESDETQALLQSEFDETQVQLTAFQAEVKAENDETQALLQTEFDQTQTDLAAFRAEVKAESDETQALLQMEFDQTQTDLAAFQAEVKAESDQTQALLQTEFDDTQTILSAFKVEAKAESDDTQALLQAEFDDTQTILSAFKVEAKAESDATQALLQSEFDQTQADFIAFQGELKSESDETQLILSSKLPSLDSARIPVEKTESFSAAGGAYTVLSNGSHGPNEIAYTSSSGAKTTVYMAYNSAGDLVWISPTPDFNFTSRPLTKHRWSEIHYAREGASDAVLVTGSNTYSYSLDAGDTWRTPVVPWNTESGNEFYQATCYGGGMWLATEIGQANGTTRPTEGFYSFYATSSLASGWTKFSVPSTYNSITAISEISYDSVNGRFMLCVEGITGKPTMFMKYNAAGGTWSFDSNTSFKSVSGGVLLVNGTYNNVVGAAGLYVGVGSGGYHKMGWSSDRGVTWNQGRYNDNQTDGGPLQNIQTGCSWSAVAYGSGCFVAVSANGSTSNFQFAYSTDGKNWHGSSYTSAGLKRNWTSVAYFAGRFVALGAYGNYQAISFDGINWTAYGSLPIAGSFVKLIATSSRLIGLLYEFTGDNIYVADYD
jgi:hypothetical protein